MKKISIVMPVHNTGVLLNKSIGTLERQSLQDFELICVDDASDDALTLQTLNSYECRCPFLKTVYLGNRMGAAQARNFGLDIATGEYVIFLDSDDEFDEFLLETMYNRAIQNHADICCCGYEEFYEDECGRHSMGIHFPKESGNAIQEWFDLKDLDETALTLWTVGPCKLFRRTFILENKIRFQTLSSCNDVYFSCMAAILAHRICYTKCDRPLIFYRQNVANQISANRNPENLLKAVKRLIKDLECRGLYDDYRNQIIAFLYEHASYELRAGHNKGQCQKFYDDLKQFVMEQDDDIAWISPEFLYFRNNLLEQEYDSGWFLVIGDFRAQLEGMADDLVEKLKGYQSIVLWGMGKRGEAFQDFCVRMNIDLMGVADRCNRNVGDFTKYGFKIIDKRDALMLSDMIVASNREIYSLLLTEDSEKQCIDLSQYCPY